MMSCAVKIACAVILAAGGLAGLAPGQVRSVLFREDFASLDDWRPLSFSSKKRSTYTIQTDGAQAFLRTQSNASASGIVYKKKFSPYDFPCVTWRWKADNVYVKGNAARKQGDDYPLRVYVLFEKERRDTTLWEKLKSGTRRLLSGEPLPDSCLIYIWANRKHREQIITNAYAERAKMIVRQQGTENIGTWQTETVNILDDYRKAFDTVPPPSATIAVMNDADDTGEGSVAYIDYFEVFRE